MNGSVTVLLVLTIFVNLPVLATTEQAISPINRDKGFLFDNFSGYKLSLKDDKFHQRSALVPGQTECVFACVGETWCLSVNFNTSSVKKGLHVCELMSAVMYDHSKNLTQDNNFIHLSIKNPCTEKPCLNDGKCTIDNNRQDYKCNCKKGFSGVNCQKGFINIFILSQGCDDIPGECKKCNISVNGVDHCPDLRRGHIVAVLDKFGVYQTKGVFDTYGDVNAGHNLKTFLTNLPDERIVLISVADSGEKHVLDAAAAIQAVGAVNATALAFRTSWLLVGYKGGSPPWITEKRADRYKGPSQANITIPVPVT